MGAFDASQHSFCWATVGQRHFGTVITLAGQQANRLGIMLVANLKREFLFVNITLKYNYKSQKYVWVTLI